jgi:hypothetical protein
MKRIQSYEINQPKGSDAEVIGINYESDGLMYIVEFLRAMGSALKRERLNRRQFSILVIVAERGERGTSANDLRMIVGFRGKTYIDDLNKLESRGLLTYEREGNKFNIRLTLSCYEWLSKVLPSFKFVRPKHLIFD